MLRFRARIACLALLALFVLAVAAPAAERRFYLSAKWGSSDVDGNVGDNFQQIVNGDDDSTGFELGYRFVKFLGVQIGYHDFGEVGGFGSPCPPREPVCPASLVPIVADTTAYSIAVVPRLPLLGTLALFGKVGLARWESELGVTFADDGGAIGEFDGEDLIYGVGLRMGLIGPVSIFGEYEVIDDLIETIAFGATLTF